MNKELEGERQTYDVSFILATFLKKRIKEKKKLLMHIVFNFIHF